MGTGDPFDGIGRLAVPKLREAWTARLGEPPPALRTRELLSLALAYRLQARAHGDLPGPLKRKVAELAGGSRPIGTLRLRPARH